MRKDKEEALRLRREGKSYKEIHTLLAVPLGTLSDWLGREEWSEAIRKRLTVARKEEHTIRLVDLNKVRGQHLKEAYEAAIEEAKIEFEYLKYDPLFIAGVMLYWGGGAKDPKQGVKFDSSGSKMIHFYVEFLKKSCHIPTEKIRAYVLIYPEIEEKTSRAYWSKMSGLPWENFTSSIVLEGRRAKRGLSWGVCTVHVSNTYFKQKMLTWMKLLPEELLGEAYYENIERSADMV